MSNTVLNQFLSQGTNADRLAYVPDPPTALVSPQPGYDFYETDTGLTYAWDTLTSAWVLKSGGTSGTVTTVSVASANGLAGSVANPTTTPAITLSTSVTGLVKGNGTALSAATAGTDYSAGTAALATGIVKSTTGTGGLTIAVAGDFPTLNQNTSGSAATLSAILAASLGGTGIDSSALTGFGYVTAGTWAAKTAIQAQLLLDVAAAAIASTAIDWATAITFTKTLAANTTFTFSNAADGETRIVALTNTASNYTVTWPTVVWSGGTPPVQTVGAKTDIYTFIKIGSTIYGSVVQNFS